MKLIIDANSVIAALIKDSKTREIIFSDKFTLIPPDYLLEEINKHKDYISQKSNVPRNELDILITLILKRINIVPYNEYKNKIARAKELIKNDQADVPYVACYLRLNCDGICTNDSDYQNKPELIIFKTEDLLKLL